MSDQEQIFFQEPREDDGSLCTTMLQLTAGKRQSPHSPHDSFQQPHSKRAATLHFPPSPSGADRHLLGGGFAKLQLPFAFPTVGDSPLPPLIRTSSAPPEYSTDNVVNSSTPHPRISELPPSPLPISTNQLPEISQRTLPRTFSDPSPVNNWQALPSSGTPARPPTGRTPSRSPSCGDSPSTKRLKRMKERLREMSQWWNHVVSEGNEEDDESENYYDNNFPKEEQPESEIENSNNNPAAVQEAVWVEKDGECLVLHFKCPCGNGYQILLSGRNCYYKLTNF